MSLNNLQSGWTSGHDSASDGTESHVRTNDTNDSFFQRPVRILSTSWEVGQQLYLEFNPWKSFCEDPRIANRLAHFRNLKMKLHVQVMINGNPFYYGKAIMSYTPLPDADLITSFSSGDRAFLLEMSQKPHIYLDPTKCEGGELELPFIWPKSFLNIISAEWRSMGVVQLRSFNSLQHANAATDSVNITVFAYATEVELNTPTSRTPVDLQPQGGDEYGSISMPAHTGSKIAHILARAPVIGSFARATEMVLNTVKEVAMLFGYSKPRMIPTDLALIQLYGQLANVNAVDTSQSVALDAKKEITIDPRVTGSNPKDEMSLVELASRECYLDTFVWRETDPAGQHLYTTDVQPILGAKDSSNNYHLTPAAFVAVPFEFWKGSMELRLQVVASAYHRGRIRVVWDPDYIVDGTTFNVNYSTILDISESTEATFRIGWGQEYDYLRVQKFPDYLDTRNITLEQKTKNPFANGKLSIYVVNPLTSPSQESTYIALNTFVKMCDDFEVASPTDLTMKEIRVTRYAPRTPDSSEPGVRRVFKALGPIIGRDPVPPVYDANISNQGYSVEQVQRNYTLQFWSDAAKEVTVPITFAWNRGPGSLRFKYGGTEQTLVGTDGQENSVTMTLAAQPGWNTANFAAELLTGATPYMEDVDMLVPPDVVQEVLEPSTIIPRLKFASTADQTTADPQIKFTSFPQPTIPYLELQDIPYFDVELPGWVPGTQVSIAVGTNMKLQGSPYSDYYDTSPGNNLLNDLRVLSVVPSVPRIRILSSGNTTDAPRLFQIRNLTYMRDINFTPQGEVEENSTNVNSPEDENPVVTMGPTSHVRGLNDIYFGEYASSIRQLLKRFETAYFFDNPDGTTPGSYVKVAIAHYPTLNPNLANQPGWAYTINPTLFGYFTSAFVCMRGGMRVKVLLSKKVQAFPVECQMITRFGTDTNRPLTVSIVPESTPTNNQYKIMRWAGSAVDYNALKPFFEFELPYYSNLRFTPARSNAGFDRPKYVERATYDLDFGLLTANNLTTFSYATAEDFSLSFFLSTPVLSRR